MLRVQADITGRGTIADLAVHNTGETHPADSGLYRYNIYNIDDIDTSETPCTDGERLDEVWHYRDDGAAMLLRKVFTQIGELPDDE